MTEPPGGSNTKDDVVDNKVFDKIEKLLALSGSPNPHEAAAALAMAQKIMADHGLTASDIALGALTHEQTRSMFSSTKPRNFEVGLSHAVAKAFGCSPVWQGLKGGYGWFIFVGPKSRVPSCAHFFQVLSRKMAKGRASFIKTLPSRANKTAEGDGWCLGYVFAVSKAVAEVSGVKADPADLQRYADTRLGAGGEAKISRKDGGSFGMLAGHLAGRDEKLYQPMENSTQDKIS
jgi:hypothetical protein